MKIRKSEALNSLYNINRKIYSKIYELNKLEFEINQIIDIIKNDGDLVDNSQITILLKAMRGDYDNAI